MKYLLTLCLAVAMVGQQPKPVDLRSAGNVSTHTNTIAWTSTAPVVYLPGQSTKHLFIDDSARYHHVSVIIRNNERQPISFCNIPMQRCWLLATPPAAK